MSNNINNPATQSTAAYANEMDPTQTTTGPTAPYTTTETTTTTHTSRAPHSTTTAGNTTAGPFATSGGTVGNKRVESGQGMMGKIKGAAAAVHGTGEALRGAFNTSVDKMAGDQAGVAKDSAVQDKGLGEIRQRDFHPATTSGMTGQGSMTGTGGLTGTGAGGVVGQDARVPGGSSGDTRNAAMHDASLGRHI